MMTLRWRGACGGGGVSFVLEARRSDTRLLLSTDRRCSIAAKTSSAAPPSAARLLFCEIRVLKTLAASCRDCHLTIEVARLKNSRLPSA